MPVVTTRPRAKSDLVEIWDYIAEDSEARADAFVDMIGKKFLALASNPGVGRARNELADGLRCFPVGRYAIIYCPIIEGIEIIRVLHGSRDIELYFMRTRDLVASSQPR